MGASLIFYTSSALTTQQFVLPVGTGETPLTLSSFSSFTEDDETYYYFTGGWNPLTSSNVIPYNMTGKDYTPAITDGLSTAYIKYNSGNDNAVWDTWYYDSHVVRNSGGTAQNDPRIAAAEVLVEGVPFIALGGFDMYGVLSPSLMVSKNMFGSKAFTQQGGPDTPPGSGADANSGWGTYDYSSELVQGSATPTAPSLPISTSGHGIHAYTLNKAAYEVISEKLWGVGDSSAGIAVSGDLWQRWQNYRFNPTAGILSCVKLPTVFTPVRTLLSDTFVRIAGTTIGNQYTPITGCKEADCTPIEYEALNVSIPEQFGSYLDYDGGMEITLVLPFCGRMQLDPSACVGGGVRVLYKCDPTNGNVAAFVYVTGREIAEQLYQTATGNCAQQIPMIGHDDGQIQMLGTLAADGLGIASSMIAGNPIGVASGVLGAASAVMQRQEATQVVGSYAGSVNYISNVCCYLIVSKSHAVKSPYYDDTIGRPNDYGHKVGDYAGFTVFHNIDVDIPDATAAERDMIAQLLEGGVIL